MASATVIVVLGLLLVATSCHGLGNGPCPKHKLHTVDVDLNEWKGHFYVNIEAFNKSARCQWISRSLTYKDKSVHIKDYFLNLENNKPSTSEVVAKYVSKGYFTFESELYGQKATFHDYFVHFNPPHLICHVVCTDSPYFKHGQYQFFCESEYPDAPKNNAPIIKKIAEKNGIDLSKMMLVNNCDCPNIPYLRGSSKCESTSLEKYLGSY